MATLDYVDIPPGATRLRASSYSERRSNSKQPAQTASSDLRPAFTVYTSLPHPSPPSSPATSRRRQISLTASTAASSVMSPTLGLTQMLLSAAMPGGLGVTPNTVSSEPATEEGAGSTARDSSTSGHSTTKPTAFTNDMPLLSTRDPLSLPVMSNNFRRFVAKVGPVFWMQDRVEEVVMWKRGWKVTGTWMAAYVFLCWFPRIVLLIPHVCVAGVILSTYPYPGGVSKDQTTTHQQQQNQGGPGLASGAAEGSVPWQANIQAIQNLMGAVSDLITLVEPYVYHFVLSPAHFRDPAQLSSSTTHISSCTSSSSSSISTSGSSIAAAFALGEGGNPSAPRPQTPQFQHPTPFQSTRPISPYTPHILTLLALTFPFTVYLISLPHFPVRMVFIIGGLLPFVCTNPWVQRVGPRLIPSLIIVGGEIGERLGDVYQRVLGYALPGHSGSRMGEKRKGKRLEMVIQRVIDDDRLSDKCWNSEMREVELWENERFGGSLSDTANVTLENSNVWLSNASTASTGSGANSNSTWSKANLRQNERAAWTRGRDGWTGVGVGGFSSNGAGSGGGGGGVEVQGEVSNLTFSLGPGWSFVETENWRKDILAEWSGVGADLAGWVYTNDAWLGARPAPYTAGGGSVTRRRRWTRRVWYDTRRAE